MSTLLIHMYSICIAIIVFVYRPLQIDNQVYIQKQSHNALPVADLNSVHLLPKWNHNIICVLQEQSSRIWHPALLQQWEC